MRPARWSLLLLSFEVPVRSEVERVGKRILCFYGEHEKDSLCLDLPASVVVAIAELSHGRSGIGAGHDAMTGRGAAAFSRVGTPWPTSGLRGCRRSAADAGVRASIFGFFYRM